MLLLSKQVVWKVGEDLESSYSPTVGYKTCLRGVPLKTINLSLERNEQDFVLVSRLTTDTPKGLLNLCTNYTHTLSLSP